MKPATFGEAIEAVGFKEAARLLGRRRQSAPPRKSERRAPELIARMRREIIEDVRAGVVPRRVRDFSELHDYVDANCYGGFCDEPNDYFPEQEQYPREHEADHALVSACQDAIHEWIKSGALLAFRRRRGALVPSR